MSRDDTIKEFDDWFHETFQRNEKCRKKKPHVLEETERRTVFNVETNSIYLNQRKPIKKHHKPNSAGLDTNSHKNKIIKKGTIQVSNTPKSKKSKRHDKLRTNRTFKCNGDYCKKESSVCRDSPESKPSWISYKTIFLHRLNNNRTPQKSDTSLQLIEGADKRDRLKLYDRVRVCCHCFEKYKPLNESPLQRKSQDSNGFLGLLQRKAIQEQRTNSAGSMRAKKRSGNESTSNLEAPVSEEKEKLKEESNELKNEDTTHTVAQTEIEEVSKNSKDTDCNVDYEYIMDMLDEEMDKISIMYSNKNDDTP